MTIHRISPDSLSPEEIELANLERQTRVLESSIERERKYLGTLSQSALVMRFRAESAEKALKASDLALAALKILSLDNRKMLDVSDTALSALRDEMIGAEDKLKVKDAALKALMEISKNNKESIRVSSLALSAVTELAFTDALTGLPNRRLLDDRLGQAILVNKRKKTHGAILFFDLDKFKKINDLYGHEVGDKLLYLVGERLMNCVRETDTVARYGGDEFVILLGDLAEDYSVARAEVSQVSEKILLSLERPYNLKIDIDGVPDNDIEYRCTSSIGVAMFGGQGEDVHKILDWADEAMYWSKNDGGNSVRFYDVKESADKALQGLYALATSHDIETAKHGIRTSEYVKALANRALKMNLYPDELSEQIVERLFKVTPLHDIGKTKIPYAILHKHAEFTPAEWGIMKGHTLRSEEILLDAKKQNSSLEEFLDLAIKVAVSHHERWDGEGYPHQLAGPLIPLSGRLMAIADVYDALINRRDYKAAWSEDAAYQEIVNGSGTQFDPLLIQAFILEREAFNSIAKTYQD